MAEHYPPAELLREGDPAFFEPSPYIVVLVALGVVALASVILPRVLERRPLTMPMVFIAVGVLAAWTVLPDPPAINERLKLTERLTELGVIISLFSAGLKLGRPFAWKTWRLSWRLLAFTMPLTIAGVALLGRGLFGLPLAACLLLGAVLAPTDPVLASDTQAEAPGNDEDDPDPVRTALTSEAGVNDGLAFPFTYLAIAIAAVGPAFSEWFVPWILFDVIYKIAVGIGAGWACGWLLSQTFRLAPPKGDVARRVTGSIALPITVLTYGCTELLSGYGFIAVFVAACVVRTQELKTHEHRRLHDFAEEIERLVAALLLMMLGAALVGPLLNGVTLLAVAAACVILLVIRPAAGMLGMIAAPVPFPQRIAVSFLGIRGIGSIYYFAYALGHIDFEHRDLLWSIIGLTVVGSIVIHGLTARPILRWANSSRSSPARSDEV